MRFVLTGTRAVRSLKSRGIKGADSRCQMGGGSALNEHLRQTGDLRCEKRVLLDSKRDDEQKERFRREDRKEREENMR